MADAEKTSGEGLAKVAATVPPVELHMHDEVPEGFRFTDYTRMKGWGTQYLLTFRQPIAHSPPFLFFFDPLGCKVPQKVLLKLLEGLGDGKIGMDSSVKPLARHEDLFLVSTTDFFYPLIDDPYIMVRHFNFVDLHCILTIQYFN